MNQVDARITAGAKTLANRMGTPKDWLLWCGDVKAVLEAADSVDPLRKETKMSTEKDSPPTRLAEARRYAKERALGPDPDFETVAIQAKMISKALSLHVAEGNGCCITCWDFKEDKDVKFPCLTSVALGVDPKRGPFE